MPDTKITALTAIGANPIIPSTFPIPMVDLTDTSMAASGTTKKVTVNQILGAGGTATLASATITGDLTVDTSTLKVDSANNRVGIGTASPTQALSVSGAIDFKSYVAHMDNFAVYAHTSDGTTISSFTGYPIVNRVANSERYKIASDGVATWSNVGGVAGTAMTLNATGLGVGKVPASNQSKVQIYQALGTSLNGAIHITDDATTSFVFNNTSSGVSSIWTSGALTFSTGSNAYSTNGARMTLDASGNLLVGTTTAPTFGKLHVANGIQVSGSGTGGFITSRDGTDQNAYLSLGANFGVANSYDIGLAIANIAAAAGKRITITNRTAGVYLDDGGTSWNAVSDERFKDIIEPISNAVSKVGLLRSVIGKLKTDDASKRRSFLIAQDVKTVLPEAVDASNPDQLGLAYTDIIPLLVAAIKELTARVQTLETR